MNLLRSRFAQAVLILIVAFVVLKFGIRPAAPWSVLTLYMSIVLLAVLVFVSSDSDSWRDFVRPIRALVVDPDQRVGLLVFLIVLPLLLGYYAYTQAAAKPQAPPELRAVHPAPPASIQFRGKEIQIAGLDNPLRKDHASFKRHVAPVGGGALTARHLAVAAAVALALSGAPSRAAAQAGDAGAGKAVYERKCAGCHGEKGDGKGPAAELLAPKPRDFTAGLYKIRSTANKVPTDQDIFRVITDGMPGTSMPPWAVLPENDRWNLVAYVKTFAAEKFKEGPKKLELPKDVASSPESIKRGKEMFEAIECHKCHGTDGRADGPSRAELKDEWGNPVPPANLTKPWTFRGGAGRTEIATRLANGVLGTPMPAFLDSVEKPEDIWHLTNFIRSLGPESPRYATLVTVTAGSDAIPDDAT